MKVNNYPLKTPSAGDKLFGSDSNGDQKQFDMSNFGTSTYKVYVALLTQTGTDDPTVITVLENTFENPITFTRYSPGQYAALSSEFIQNKTFAIFQSESGYVRAIVVTNAGLGEVGFWQYDSELGTDVDGLGTTCIEIRVYN